MFNDILVAGAPISWLDVGAGYGEVVEAVSGIAPSGSRVVGVEPMEPKARWAKSRGLPVRQGYLSDIDERFKFISLINVFSHVPDFGNLLADLRRRLEPGGELLLETGNLADVPDRKSFTMELFLPDHLVFAGEVSLQRYLSEGGFEMVSIKRLRVDGWAHWLANVAKRIRGRPVILKTPFTSPFRTLLVRARRLA